MKKHINPSIRAHLRLGTFYVLLLMTVCAITFALGQRNASKPEAPSPNLQPSPLTYLGTSAPCEFRVLIIYTEFTPQPGPPNTLRNQVLAEPDVTVADLLNGSLGTPTLQQLQQYSIVFTFGGFQAWADAAAMGNVLADYEDAGGVVVVGTSWEALQGRWITGGYTPYNSGQYYTAINNVTITQPWHPLMRGVTSLSAVRRDTPLTLTSGAISLAEWPENAASAVAYKTNNGHTAVGINAYLGLPDQFSDQWARVIVNAGRWLLGPHDFNHDGHSDLLLYNAGTRQSVALYMFYNVLVGVGVGPTLPVGWNIKAVADFNGDRKLDYLLFNASTRQTVILYLSGVTPIGAAFGPTLPSGWDLVAVGNFNEAGDCDPDYVLYNASTRQTMVYYLHNNVFAGSSPGPSLPAGWRLAGVADFDLDGNTDFLLFKASTLDSVIVYLSGTDILGAALGPRISTGYELIGTANFNLEDQSPDYLLYNPSTRQIAIWYMANNVLISTSYGPILPARWSVVAH